MKRHSESITGDLNNIYLQHIDLHSRAPKFEDYSIYIKLFAQFISNIEMIDPQDLHDAETQDMYQFVFKKILALRSALDFAHQDERNEKGIAKNEIAKVYRSEVNSILKTYGIYNIIHHPDRLSALQIQDQLTFIMSSYGVTATEENMASSSVTIPMSLSIDSNTSSSSSASSLSSTNPYKRAKVFTSDQYLPERNQFFAERNFFIFAHQEDYDHAIELYSSPFKWIEKIVSVIHSNNFEIKSAIYQNQNIDSRALYILEGYTPQSLELHCLDSLIKAQVKIINTHLKQSTNDELPSIRELYGKLIDMHTKMKSDNLNDKTIAMLGFSIFDLIKTLESVETIDYAPQTTLSLKDMDTHEMALNFHNSQEFTQWLLVWSNALIEGQYLVNSGDIPGIIISNGPTISSMDYTNPKNLSFEYLVNAAISQTKYNWHANNPHLVAEVSKLHEKLIRSTQSVTPKLRYAFDMITNFIIKSFSKIKALKKVTEQGIAPANTNNLPENELEINLMESSSSIAIASNVDHDTFTHDLCNNRATNSTPMLALEPPSSPILAFDPTLTVGIQVTPKTTTVATQSNIGTQCQSRSTQTDAIERPIAKKDNVTQYDKPKYVCASTQTPDLITANLTPPPERSSASSSTSFESIQSSTNSTNINTSNNESDDDIVITKVVININKPSSKH